MTYNLGQALSAYRVAASQGHPLVIVVRLYDEVLRQIARAVEQTEARRIEEAYLHITKASMILRGLSSNLRFDKAPDLAQTLKETYVRNLVALHTSFGKPDAVERYMRIATGLTELRNSWALVAGVAEAAPLGEDKSRAEARNARR